MALHRLFSNFAQYNTVTAGRLLDRKIGLGTHVEVEPSAYYIAAANIDHDLGFDLFKVTGNVDGV